MANGTTEKPNEQENDQHGGPENKPRFGGRNEWADTHEFGLPRDNDITPGGSDSGNSSTPQKSVSPGEINNAENQAGAPDKGKVDDKEHGISDKLGKGFTGGAGGSTVDAAAPAPIKALKMVGRILGGKKGFTKKKGAAGGIATLLVTGVIFLFSIVSGPAQLVQLAELLRKVFGNSEQTAGKRFGTNLRYLRTGEVGETRVGVLRSYLKGKYIKQLSAQGIEFTNKTPLGRPGMSIDTSDPSQNKFKGLSDKELKSAAGLPDDADVRVSRQGSKVFLDFDYKTVAGQRNGRIAAENITKNTGVGRFFDGKIGSSVKFRAVLGPYFGLKGLLSPKLAAVKGEQYAGRLNAVKAEEKRASPRTERTKAVTVDVRNRLRDKISPQKTLIAGAALGAHEVGCLVHESASDAVEFNHKAIVVASAAEAADKIAVGEKAKAGSKPGSEIDIGRAGAVAQSFEDEDGETIWGAAGIQALSTNGRDVSGEEIPREYQQAYSNETTANNIQENTQQKIGPIDATKIICGPIGTVAGLTANIALLVAGPVTLGGSWAVFAAKTGSGIAASYGVMALFSNQLTKLLSTDLLVKPPLNGPLGGNLLAYGARAGANMGALSSGGIALSKTQAVTFLEEQEAQELKEFTAKPFFARMFDIYDYRSLAGKSARNISPKPINNVAAMASGITNISSSFANIFSSILPKAFAQDAEAYVWGFPIYGIPDDVLDDPDLADPNENDKIISDLLDSSEGGEYRDRARACFGVNLNKDSGEWAAPITEDVNPASKEYTDNNCGDLSKTNWKRIMLFVFDTHLMTSLACYEGNEEACTEIGIETGSSTSAGGGNASSSASCEQPSGTTKDVIDKVVIPIAKDLGFNISVESVEAANAAHSTDTASGNLSDHKGPPERAWAADISNGSNPTPEMDQLAEELSDCFGIPWEGSGAISHTAGGYRFQIIYRSNVGGNHYNHVHIGIAAQ